MFNCVFKQSANFDSFDRTIQNSLRVPCDVRRITERHDSLRKARGRPIEGTHKGDCPMHISRDLTNAWPSHLFQYGLIAPKHGNITSGINQLPCYKTLDRTQCVAPEQGTYPTKSRLLN